MGDEAVDSAAGSRSATTTNTTTTPATATAASTSTATEAVVESIGFDVAPDSDGLLIVTLRFPNGARSDLQLEAAGLSRVLEELGLATARGLVGRRFSELAPALPTNARD